MKRLAATCLAVIAYAAPSAACLAIVAASAPVTRAAETWAEGQHYAVLTPPQRTSVPAGKVEVMEVFSYACPACSNFQPVMIKLKQSLPANVQLVLLPASFNTSEDWPMFQRAYFTAQSLGIAERTHQAMFDAVWNSGELAVADPATHHLKSPQPSIQDAARFYARVGGIKPEAFLAAASSFQVDTKIRAADAQIAAMKVPGTPCIVVNGKYRVDMQSVRNTDQLIDLVKFLVAKESGG
jgi:protein dithiol oxidoreductase (disulfide-forming)